MAPQSSDTWDYFHRRSLLNTVIHAIFYTFLLSNHFVAGLPASKAVDTTALQELTCRNVAYDPFDYSVKVRWDENAPICLNPTSLSEASAFGKRDDDYSCNESKACSNGACCGKTQGYCGYGPDYCGTNDISPNDVCWSNCDAKAECGQYAAEEGAECTLNVCCSQYGFCGMTDEFCEVTDNTNTTCQSNCEQPGSGSSDGDVQSRIIGYYEAWNANKSCVGMTLSQIPVNALTHLHFAFLYINPGDFKIVPMDGIDESLLTDFTALKSKNSGLKCIASIGGWTFSDNGTVTQPLFGEIAGDATNRATFITNLLDFMREYAFDGVDFDWEYPGATDRGGTEDDGENFTQLLKELREAIDDEPIDYSIAFTAPTSYWYLRHFDLKKSSEYVDWINVMSYDLHGVWDSSNPIGSTVLAHTNLTEIKLALDLFWRNDIDANKINLGLGFYGRSFQLADPTCYKPGCAFKGGANAGSCTDNSGTLAYFEIQDIIDAKGLTPYYDKTAQVKYIVWDNDQWVSYDDEDTFQAKIEFANDLGLGGLLIWSIDQDTSDYQALKAVLSPSGLDAFEAQADDASYWQEATAQDCYVTDCGGSCKTGFIQIEEQPCGSAKPVTRHSTEDPSKLCCPLTSAPDPDNCQWRGSAPSCNGHCENGEVMLEMNKWGDGKYCEDGNKAYCCEASSQETENTCYWTGVGGDCASDELPLTFAGTFLEDVADIVSFGGLTGLVLAELLDGLDMDLRRLYCCPKDEISQWENCGWHGTPGTCYDNHCDEGTQVQLTESYYGAGESCLPRIERQRTFCCDPAGGASPFLPVPLEYLFPNAPDGDDIETDYDLEIDDTWGTGKDKTSTEDDPNDSTFGFWVMVSPTEIQTSLDKRDGSHWELFNCNDAVSTEEQTIQMVCTDDSEESNCYKIGLGHGVPGTILEMPKGQGCGPAKYAVAKSMVPSANQTLPHHLEKRVSRRKPVVYDLTFDYDWHRVPRDLGDTQVRVDYSNEDGYWDAIVDKAAEKRRKRSLDEVSGNHRRWLEEEWRDDMHFSNLSERELHERWFGEDVIAWLQGLLNGEIKPKYTHDYDESVTAIIVQEDWSCQPNEYTKLEASLSAKATASIKVSSTFGMTLIFTLGTGMDLSSSYVYLKTSGEVTAIFSIDAMAKASFDSGEFSIITIPMPGASFTIPNILTVGPKFILNAQATADVELAGHFETRVEVASWDFQQTYPEANDDWEPKSLEDASRDFNLDGLNEPTFNLSVTAKGQMTAHLKPTLSFGIDFEDRWNIDSCKAELVADGWVRVRAQANIAGDDAATCPLKYGIDAGASLTARASVPDNFGWNPADKEFFPLSSNLIPGDGTDDYVCVGVDSETETKRGLSSRDGFVVAGGERELLTSHGNVTKRSVTYGPLFSIPVKGQLCPTIEETTEAACNTIKGFDDDVINETANMKKRGLDPLDLDFSEIEHASGIDITSLVRRRSEVLDTESDASRSALLHDMLEDLLMNNTELLESYHELSRRDSGSKFFEICKGDAVMSYKTAAYPDSGILYDNEDWSECSNFNLIVAQSQTAGHSYDYEHILERQIIQAFAEYYFMEMASPVAGYDSYCKYLRSFWTNSASKINGQLPWDYIGAAWPNTASGTGGEMVQTEAEINTAKARAFKFDVAINAVDTMKTWVSSYDDVERVIKNLKDVILMVKYMNVANVNSIYNTQARRVAAAFGTVEQGIAAAWAGTNTPYTIQNLDTDFLTFMRDYTTQVSGKIDDYLQLWSGSLQVFYDTEVGAGGQTAAQLNILTKIEDVRTEVGIVTANSPLFTNPF